MDSTRELLKQISDLTRNIDSLTKEIKESNSNNSSILKKLSGVSSSGGNSNSGSSKNTASNAGSNSSTGSSSSGSTSTPSGGSTPAGGNKESKTPNKTTPTKDKKKNSALEVLKSAGKAALNIKGFDIIQSKLKDKGINVDRQTIEKGASKVSDLSKLKEKEKVKEPEKSETKEDTKKEENKFKISDLNPLNLFKNKKNKDKEDKKPEKNKDLSKEGKGFFDKLIERVSGKKNQTAETPAKKPEEKKEGSKLSLLDRAKSFFGKKKENETSGKESKESKEEAKLASQTKVSPEKSGGESGTGVKESEAVKTIEKAKSKYEQKFDRIKEKLKSTFDNLGGKSKENKSKEAGSSDMKKETTSLKTPTGKTDQPQQKTEENKPATPVEPTSSPKSSESSKTGSTSGNTSGSSDSMKSATPAAKSGNTEGVISPQDIQDIKALLSAMNATLNGPLTIKDNKPFRPKSSMLE